MNLFIFYTITLCIILYILTNIFIYSFLVENIVHILKFVFVQY